jgi:hypothetical protein
MHPRSAACSWTCLRRTGSSSCRRNGCATSASGMQITSPASCNPYLSVLSGDANPDNGERGQLSCPEWRPACGARRVFSPADLAASSAGNGRSNEDKGGGPESRTGGNKKKPRRQGMEPWFGGERPGKQAPERGRSEGNGRPEEGGGCNPRRQRPEKRSDVPESGRPQLVKNKQREEHGTAQLLLQCSGGVCREGYFLLPFNE